MGELEGSQVINGSWKCLIKFLINIKGAKTIILVKYDFIGRISATKGKNR